MKFLVSFDGRISITGDLSPDKADVMISEHLDEVMEELIHLGAEDPDIALDLNAGAVAVGLVVDAGNPLGAASQASGLLRTAVHKAGGATPDWPGPHEEAWAVQLVRVESELVRSPDECDDENVDELVGA